VVPEHDGEIVLLPERFQLLQAVPIVGVHHDQAGDFSQVQFPDGADLEEVSMEGQELFDIAAEFGRQDPGCRRIQVGGGYQGSQRIKIGIGVGGGDLHETLPLEGFLIFGFSLRWVSHSKLPPGEPGIPELQRTD